MNTTTTMGLICMVEDKPIPTQDSDSNLISIMICPIEDTEKNQVEVTVEVTTKVSAEANIDMIDSWI